MSIIPLRFVFVFSVRWKSRLTSLYTYSIDLTPLIKKIIFYTLQNNALCHKSENTIYRFVSKPFILFHWPIWLSLHQQHITSITFLYINRKSYIHFYFPSAVIAKIILAILVFEFQCKFKNQLVTFHIQNITGILIWFAFIFS